MRKVLNVHIGEVKIAKKGEILKAILGSCVGIAFIWTEKGVCGLAHCLLPESPEETFEINARYVNQAVPSLIALMKIKPENLNRIRVIVVGGGNMTQVGTKNKNLSVGYNNLTSAIRELAKYKLSPFVIEPGKDHGKKIMIDANDFSYKIENIPRIIEAA